MRLGSPKNRLGWKSVYPSQNQRCHPSTDFQTSFPTAMKILLMMKKMRLSVCLPAVAGPMWILLMKVTAHQSAPVLLPLNSPFGAPFPQAIPSLP